MENSIFGTVIREGLLQKKKLVEDNSLHYLHNITILVVKN